MEFRHPKDGLIARFFASLRMTTLTCFPDEPRYFCHPDERSEEGSRAWSQGL